MYNKYHESLVIDCCKPDTKPKAKSKDCCPGMHLPSHSNEIEILVRRLTKEVKELMKSTEARLLCQNKKIDETMVYIKNNLSNALRNLLNAMLESGQLEDLITGIVANEIEILQADVEALKVDNAQNKANIQTNTNDITRLKASKLEFDEVEGQTVNAKFLNVDVATEYANGSIVYITKLSGIDKLSCLPTNGDPTADINTNKTNVMDYAKAHDTYDVYMNSGMNGINIFDGVVNQTTRLDCPYYCGFTADNDMKFYNGLADDFSIDDMLNDGIVNCFSGFCPIIVNHEVFDLSNITDLADDNAIALAFEESLPVKHPRQLIGQDDDGNFYIFSIMGRFNNCSGFNYDEMQSYFLAKGLKNVFSCDGGGSMQTIVNGEYVFYPSQELDTNEDREIPTIIGFKLKEIK